MIFPVFCGQFSLTCKRGDPIIASSKSKFLSNIRNQLIAIILEIIYRMLPWHKEPLQNNNYISDYFVTAPYAVLDI